MAGLLLGSTAGASAQKIHTASLPPQPAPVEHLDAIGNTNPPIGYVEFLRRPRQ